MDDARLYGHADFAQEAAGQDVHVLWRWQGGVGHGDAGHGGFVGPLRRVEHVAAVAEVEDVPVVGVAPVPACLFWSHNLLPALALCLAGLFVQEGAHAGGDFWDLGGAQVYVPVYIIFQDQHRFEARVEEPAQYVQVA